LFESRLDELCDATLCIQCSRDERRRRVQARLTASSKHFDAMEAAQLPESEKARRAGALMSTDGQLERMDLEIDAALKQLGFSSPTG
jgi:dephospho-CoA kinase